MGRRRPAHPASTPRFRDWSHLSKWTLAPSGPLHPPSPGTPRPQPRRPPQGLHRGRDTAPSSPAAQDAPAPPPRSTVEGSERPATQTEGPRGPSREVLSHPGQGAAVTAGTTRRPAYAQGAGQVTARVCGGRSPSPARAHSGAEPTPPGTQWAHQEGRGVREAPSRATCSEMAALALAPRRLNPQQVGLALSQQSLTHTRRRPGLDGGSWLANPRAVPRRCPRIHGQAALGAEPG